MASDNSSLTSYSTGAESSVADGGDTRALNELSRNDADGIDDLGEQNRTLEDAVFASLYTLSRNRKATDLRWTAARIVLEFLQMFRVVFNTVFVWKIDTNLWIWKAFYWVLFRLVVLPEGYSTYITVFYLLSSIILLSLTLTVWVAVVLKKDENGGVWLKRLVWVLQLVGLVVFSVFWVAILDYFAFMVNCDWTNPDGPAPHTYFNDQSCLAMPHLAHMVFACLMILLFAAATLCMSISDCVMNPLTRDHLASPVALTSLKTMAAKMVMVLVSTALSVLGPAQSIIMLIAAAVITYFLLRTLPFYTTAVNYVWIGLWCGIVATCTLLVCLEYTRTSVAGDDADAQLEYRVKLTWAVLYAIFPAVLCGMGLTWAVMRWRRRHLAKLAAAHAAGEASLNLRDVHRFKENVEAEFLMRVMRKWDEDGVPDPTAAAFGEFIMKCAMTRLPNSPYILTLFANLIIETRKDGQAARTQLQLAAKAAPSLLERYFIYVSLEVAKKLKSESEGLDLMGYVEFTRSYRACVRAHKLALQAQRGFWHCLLRDHVSFRDLQACFEGMERAEKAATGVYRRVMERFPTNGKLLKVYGRFLEFVRNDPWGASRYYAEAMKQGTSESLLGLAGSTSETDTSAKLTQLMGAVDEKNDGIIIMNASGIIMMINGAGGRLLGYDKGELDGKNVSTIMPQPFSSRHNSFVQRCVSTGESRILGSLRQVVALHKDRSVFPISLVVQRLCGVGTDTIFMAVLRQATVADAALVKVWVTTNGVVLCADDRFRDWFGLPGRDLVGRNISSLATDIEAFDKFIAEATSMPPENVAGGAAHTLHTRLVHKYLAPIDAEVSIEYGGSSEHVILVVNLRLLSDSQALMVTDSRGRITFATTQLAAMLGYPVKTLTDGMALSALLPPPYSQLHGGFMKDLSPKPPPSSCRAGAVVHLLAANSSRVPVTVQLSLHDDGDHQQHVIKVLPASAAQLLDQCRLEVSLNHKGVVLGVNDAATKAVFGFEPRELLGHPVAAFVNLFAQWRARFGEDESLLVLLALRAEQNHDVTYRCGLHSPLSDAEMEAATTAAASGGSTAGGPPLGAGGQPASGAGGTLLSTAALAPQGAPAVLTLSMIHTAEDDDGGRASADPDATPLLKLCLWRAEGMSSVMELDGKLSITRAEQLAGLIFGVPHSALLHKSYRALVNLPPGTGAADLLSATGKKTMLKEGAAWKMGPLRTLEVPHMDSGRMQLQMQAVSKDGKSSSKLLVMLRLTETTTGTLQPLLALRAAGADGAAADNALLAKQDSESESDGGGDGDGGGDEPRGAAGPRADSPELHERLDSRLRTEQWLSSFRKDDRGEGGEPSPRRGAPPGARSQRGPQQQQEGAPGRQAQAGRGGAGRARDEAEQDERGDEAGYYGSHDGQPGGRGSRAGGGHAYVEVQLQGRAVGGKPGGAGGGKAAFADGGSEAGGSEGGGSVASGSQASGSEALDAASTIISSAIAEDELSADWRRAKRLKKLTRMMTSSVAQMAAERFRKHTYLLTLLIVVVHVVCFVVLLTQVNARYETAQDVNDMAQATERSQMVAMRANFIQKCGDPLNAAMAVCNMEHVHAYIVKLKDNHNVLGHIHHGLYLGYTTLREFRDPRLMLQWTYTPIVELNWFAQIGDDIGVIMAHNSSLWELGNKYLSASMDVEFNALALGYKLADTSYFNYIYMNGPNSLFEGYTWSLDVFVDYAWSQLGTLNNVLVVLLVVEALIVQVSAMLYEFILLKATNLEAMKRFSVFLALPSATIRSMAARQIQVDDDDKSDLDDDELEALNATAGATTEVEQQASGKEGGDAKPKSVRMSVGAAQDDGAHPLAAKKGKAGAASAAAALQGQRKPPKTRLQVVSKLLFGWARTTYKINGKKLVPHNAVLWRFMVPLLLWVAAVIVIFGVSFQKLQGLQGPLASLNAAAHVRFRFARCRLMANMYAFAEAPDDVTRYRSQLKHELNTMKEEYDALLYGGLIQTVAGNLSFDANAPAAAFANEAFSNIFFKTTDCLRADRRTCFPPTSEWYDVTHSGLDAMVARFLDEMAVFANLPDELAFPNHTSYDFVVQVAANDMYDGLQTAASLFVQYTIARFEEVKQLHIILLVVSLVCIAAFVLKLFTPYVRKLHVESKALAGMMSLLPAEVDIEGHVKTHVLGLSRDRGGNSMHSASMQLGAPPPALGAGPGAPRLLLPAPPGMAPPFGGAGGAPGAGGYGYGYGGGPRASAQWE